MSVSGDTIPVVDGLQLPDLGRTAGLVLTSELVRSGVPKPAIRRLVRAGVLIQVRRGAYARADLVSELTGPEQLRARRLAIAAAVAVVGGNAVASHYDAAVLHGIDLLERVPEDLITVSRTGSKDGVLVGRPGIRVRMTGLPPGQTTVVGGIPVTTAARTVVDLARTTPFRSGLVAAD